MVHGVDRLRNIGATTAVAVTIHVAKNDNTELLYVMGCHLQLLKWVLYGSVNVGSLGVKSMSVIRPHVVAQCSAMDPDVVDTLSLLAPMFVESTAQLPSPEVSVVR
ncbi:hypothetical protein V6N13_113762 [Hibiscus sabdariffa]